MMTKIAILAGALLLGATAQASTSYTLNFTQASGTGLVQDGSWAISPYTGTVNGASVSLYCDDFNDNINWGQTGIAAYSTALQTTGTQLTNDTRYGIHNAPNSAYSSTAGTTLYDEMAWLATQMQHVSADASKVALQEAIWQLTNDASGPEGASPNNSSANAGTASSGLTGTAQSAAQWIQDAQLYVASFTNSTSGAGTDSWQYASSYAALNTNQWFIVTAVSSAGCTIGSEGTLGCSGAGGTGAGTAGTGNVTQEFLAYSAGGLVTSGSNSTATPEPDSFLLIGSGLLVGAVLARRRTASKSKNKD